jgi:RHS repeat-associated protein
MIIKQSPTVKYISALFALILSGALHAQQTSIREVSYAYDSTTGLLTQEIVEPNGGVERLETTYVYNTFGVKTSVSVKGASFSFASEANPYNSSAWDINHTRTSSTAFEIAEPRYPVSSVNPLGQAETYGGYDARFGVKTRVTGPNGLTTQWLFDGYGRKTQETTPDAVTRGWTYSLANISWQSDSSGPLMRVCVSTTPQVAPPGCEFINGQNQVVMSTQDVLRRATDGALARSGVRTDFDALARKVFVTRAYWLAEGNSTIGSKIEYDTLGRTSKQTAPDNVRTQFIYSPNLKTELNLETGQYKTSYSNIVGKTERIEDAMGQNVHFRYDALGNLTDTYDHYGSVIRVTYNKRGMKTSLNDPHKGVWTYSNDAFGQMYEQKNANQSTVAMRYDKLGRMVARNYPPYGGPNTGGHTALWYFDKDAAGVACKVGKLCEAKSDQGYNRKLSYDGLSRLVQTATSFSGAAGSTATTYLENYGYDSWGRLEAKQYPSTSTNGNTRLKARHIYQADGMLGEVRISSSLVSAEQSVWSRDEINADGQMVKEKVNGQLVTSVFDPVTARMSSRGAGDANALYSASYQYDIAGNVRLRLTDTPGQLALQENFSYDRVDRLKTYDVNNAKPTYFPVTMQYLANGNIHWKSDVGWYHYGNTGGAMPTKPSQLKSVVGEYRDYNDYDANGNQLSIRENGVAIKTLKYTAFDLPYEVVTVTASPEANGTSTFKYGPELQRVMSKVPDGVGVSLETWYLNGEDSLGLSMEKVVKTVNGVVSTSYRHYVGAGGRTIAQLEVPENVDPMSLGPYASSGRRYFIHDHLGSMVVAFGQVASDASTIERFHYDPWGRRRNGDGTLEGEFTTTGTHVATRGYTMHEHLPSLGLIHMNGRLYDPRLGRFMQADSVLQDPSDLQAHNRYAYVRNNPMKYTDPTGHIFIFDDLVGAIASISQALTGATGLTLEGSSLALSATGSALSASMATGFALGSLSGFIASGGDVEAALKGGFGGAISAGVAFGVGEIFGHATKGMTTQHLDKIIAHTGAGCVTAVLRGGDCASGAAGGAASAAMGPVVNKLFGDASKGEGSRAMNLVARMIVGGTASAATGGNFGNGAYSAMFEYLFNECGATGRCGRGDGGYEGKSYKDGTICDTTCRNGSGAVESSSSPVDAILLPRPVMGVINAVRSFFGGETSAITIAEGRGEHIFRDAAGHLPNTQASRDTVLNVANDARNLLGSDRFGNSWYASNSGQGQVWAQVRNNEVVNGGVNAVPRTYTPDRGLSGLNRRY